MVQDKYLPFLLHFGYFLLKATGLWQFSIVNGKLYRSYFHYIYSFFILISLPILYSISTKIIFQNSQHFRSSTPLYVIGYVFVQAQIMIFVMIYFTQFYHVKKTCRLCFQLKPWLHRTSEKCKQLGISYFKILFIFTLKSVLLPLVHSCIIFNVGMILGPNNIYHKSVYSFICAVPSFILKISPNFFYGTMQIIHINLKWINDEISQIMTEASELLQSTKTDKFQSMRRFCELSDSIDKLSQDHRKLIHLANSLARLNSMHNTIYVAYIFCLFIFESYVQYSMVAQLLRGASFSKSLLLLNLFVVVISMTECQLFVDACSNVVEEANETANLIHSEFVLHKADIRFQKSVNFGFLFTKFSDDKNLFLD